MLSFWHGRQWLLSPLPDNSNGDCPCVCTFDPVQHVNAFSRSLWHHNRTAFSFSSTVRRVSTADMANTPSTDEPDSPKVQIVESVGEDKSYKYSFTYEKATLYEFKFTRAPTPDAIDPCYRCNRRVLPKDQTKIENLLFHKQCFRCRICGLPLTHKTYHRNSSNNNKNDYDIYCRTHIGKNIAQIQRGEVPPMGVEGPSVDGQGKKYIVQVG